MRQIILLIFLAFIVAASATVNAQESMDILIDELYAKSGLEIQMAQIPEGLEMGFTQAVQSDPQLGAMPKSTLAAMQAPIYSIFTQKFIKATIVGNVQEQLSRDDIVTVLAWLNSPLGKKFTRIEEESSAPEFMQALQEYAQQFQQTPPDPARVALAQNMDAATKATDHGVEMVMKSQLAVAFAGVSILPKEKRPSYEKLAADFEAMRPQIQQALHNHIIVSFLYMYKDVPAEELHQYIAFTKTPAGTRYGAATMSGVKEMFIKGSYQWGEVIGEIIANQNDKGEA